MISETKRSLLQTTPYFLVYLVLKLLELRSKLGEYESLPKEHIKKLQKTLWLRMFFISR